MNEEEEKHGFWNLSDEDLIDELSRHSGTAITYSNTTRRQGVICEALRRILTKLSEPNDKSENTS